MVLGLGGCEHSPVPLDVDGAKCDPRQATSRARLPPNEGRVPPPHMPQEEADCSGGLGVTGPPREELPGRGSPTLCRDSRQAKSGAVTPSDGGAGALDPQVWSPWSPRCAQLSVVPLCLS